MWQDTVRSNSDTRLNFPSLLRIKAINSCPSTSLTCIVDRVIRGNGHQILKSELSQIIHGDSWAQIRFRSRSSQNLTCFLHSALGSSQVIDKSASIAKRRFSVSTSFISFTWKKTPNLRGLQIVENQINQQSIHLIASGGRRENE